MTQSTPSINELKSYTEYNVSTPTSVFTIGFQYEHNVDHVNVYVDGVEATAAGYTIQHDSQGTVQLTPAVPSGVVLLQRETNVDGTVHTFSAGAKFTAGTMDENFKQIRHSQQEVRDGFSKLSDDAYAIIDTLQDVGQAAQDAADAAEQAAITANDAAAQVNDKVSYQDLDNAIAATPHNNLADRNVAGAHNAGSIMDANGKDQQWINNKVTINVKSVAELRTIDLLDDGRLYNVAAYRENTGYGGGLFRYDKNSTATDDRGVVIQHNSADGRFIRVNTNFLTVEDFGADPTYTLDSTSAFQNFLNKFGDFRTKDGGKYKVTAALTRTGFFKASGKSEIVFDFSNNTAFTIDADNQDVDLGCITYNGASDLGKIHRIIVRVNETSGVFGDKHKFINHHYESSTFSLYLWNYGYSCLSNGTYKDITGVINGTIGDSIGPVRAVYGAGDRDCGALVIKGGVAENINNVDANKNVVWEDADAFVVQLPHKGDLIVSDVVYANVGKRLVKSNANSKSITKVSGCTGSSAWTSANPTDPNNKGMYSIASAYAGVLQFYDNTHVGGICQHMIETGGAVDVIEHSNIYEPEYSFQTNSQNTRIFRHSATGDSKIIHGLSIVKNVASGGYVEGAASVIELANIQDLAVGGADIYNLNNHIISGNILTGRGTSQYVHRYRGTIGSFSVNGNIYKDWQDCIYLGTDLDAALMIGSVSGNLMKNVSRNLVSEFGTGTAGKIGYSGNYSSNYTGGGKSAVLGQTLPTPTITAGGGTALPATPLGYLNVSVNGVASYIPYYR